MAYNLTKQYFLTTANGYITNICSTTMQGLLELERLGVKNASKCDSSLGHSIYFKVMGTHNTNAITKCKNIEDDSIFPIIVHDISEYEAELEKHKKKLINYK